MKVLALSAQVPYPPHHGKAMRDYHLLSGLARRHDLELLCLARDAEEIAAAAPLAGLFPFAAVPRPAHRLPSRLAALFFSPTPDLVRRCASPAFRQLLDEHLRRHSPDILLVEGLEMAAHGLWARERLRRMGRPLPTLILDEHNAEYLLQWRAWEIARRERRLPAALYSRVQAGRLQSFEARACRAADRVLAVSPADRAALLRIAPEASIAIVPNGVDCSAYAPLPPPADPHPPTLIFTGRMDFRPNVDAAQWFGREIWPQVRAAIPEARFQIVGRSPTPAVEALRKFPGIEVVGAVPDDRPYIGRADLYILPMRFGGGIRFKLLQALAMERAVVSTPLGAEGVEGLVDGEHLRLAAGAEAFAACVVELLRRPEERLRLGRAGRELVVSHYDWQVILPRLEAALAG
ncbi:MAG: glycosyltransferase family 4 protein [Chloroflexia bacterium]